MPWRSRRSSTPILQAHPQPAARPAFPPHGRELAPFRIDGVSGPSWIPRCDNPVPAPVWGPTSTRISPDASPLPKPVFQSAQMYSRYPSEFRAFLQVLQGVQQPAVLPTAPQARPGPYTAAPPAVRPSSSALVRQADLHALNGPNRLLWQQLASLLQPISTVLADIEFSRYSTFLVDKLLSSCSDTTLLRYLHSLLSFFHVLRDLQLDLVSLTSAQVMDALLSMAEGDSGPSNCTEGSALCQDAGAPFFRIHILAFSGLPLSRLIMSGRKHAHCPLLSWYDSSSMSWIVQVLTGCHMELTEVLRCTTCAMACHCPSGCQLSHQDLSHRGSLCRFWFGFLWGQSMVLDAGVACFASGLLSVTAGSRF